MKKALLFCTCLSLASIIGLNIYASTNSSAYCSVDCSSGAMITCTTSPCSAGDNYVECNGVKTYCGTEENQQVFNPTQP